MSFKVIRAYCDLDLRPHIQKCNGHLRSPIGRICKNLTKLCWKIWELGCWQSVFQGHLIFDLIPLKCKRQLGTALVGISEDLTKSDMKLWELGCRQTFLLRSFEPSGTLIFDLIPQKCTDLLGVYQKKNL